MTIDRHEIEAFLYREARLMDQHAYDEWLALWTDEALYWVPCNHDDIDPAQEVSLIYDNHARLEERITRLKSSAAYAQQPRSRLCRLLGNVEIEAQTDDQVTVHSTFNLTAVRHHRQQTFAGRTVHTLRRQQGTWKLAAKKVLLVNNDEVIDNLTFLV